MMRLIGRTSAWLLTAISAVSCLAFVLFGLPFTGLKILSVPTGSMRPAIQPGSVVLVHRVPAASLKVGDVITYTSPLDNKKTISHRIIKTYLIDNKVRAYVTKGDANLVADIPITSGRVIGKVVWHTPYFGSVMITAKKPWVILPIIYLVALLVIIDELFRLNEYFKQKQPYRLFGYKRRHVAENVQSGKPIAVGGTVIAAAVILLGAVFTPVAHALLKSNTVKLTHNTISVAAFLPTNKDQCKDNGWKIYGVFKNQGDCVSFVATHGKNPPSGG